MRKILLTLGALALVAALAVPALAATRTVKVGDDWFVRPSGSHNVLIRKGSSVKWVWTGRIRHNVTVTRGPVKFHSRTQTKGTFIKRFTRRGSYTIVCTIHPGMEMNLRVK